MFTSYTYLFYNNRNSARNENGYANSIVSGIPKEHEVKKQNQTRHITEVENGNRDMSDVSQVATFDVYPTMQKSHECYA